MDSLRGGNGSGRSTWNLLHYDITVKPDILSKTISGSCSIRFEDHGVQKMQIDLQEPMMIDSVIFNESPLSFKREGNVYWITPAREKDVTLVKTYQLYFHGKPRIAAMPPWDGGWIWNKDRLGNPFVSVACQGLGASVWYPSKDIQSDEPDQGCTLRIIAPDTLTAVGNGKLKQTIDNHDGTKTWVWEVKNPINNYNIIPYIGKYSHFGEKYKGIKGWLDCDYWVLDYNVDVAKKQFKEVPRMLKAFEHWMGPYPFYEDGYKLVEAPHLGMEHQSSIAYGNGYMNGYRGNDLSGSGWGKKWDFIIVHESGHEWFGNNITTKDIADMWVHEGFTTYSEVLFTEYYYGKIAGEAYVQGLRQNIDNDKNIIGQYGINNEGSGDMYSKGANLIHIIRQITNNDKKFRSIVVGMNKQFYHQTVTSEQVERYLSHQVGFDLSKIFDQYLRSTQIPELRFMRVGKNKINAWWTNCVDGFNLPVKLKSGNGKYKWVKPDTNVQQFDINAAVSTISMDPNFYASLRYFVP
jgi:aminopeptidase N